MSIFVFLIGAGRPGTSEARIRQLHLAALHHSDEQRQTLQWWARQPTSSQALALCCRMVLACAEGLCNVEAGARLGVHAKTVCRWRARFLRRQLEGLVDAPRPGALRTISDEQVEQVITNPLEETLADATRWSTREMAQATGMSQTAMVRIWRVSGLKPHLHRAWKLSTDRQWPCGASRRPDRAGWRLAWTGPLGLRCAR